ncbi:MAG: flagellar export chaperone FliS [Rhodoferax sp.]|jgi:flagellar protein FliS|nr:flagellar export chaperone FliS [Rhodoferax sp.]MCL4737331.1 flagellar export chaperone FliS [Burkholderiaceae bacterium]MCP5288893.1 flagellar export chaperone FliS [Burkholderiaceae bacterium]HMQ71395.1 flagellar export chaperone FliS [Rubrivivax sp.]
MFSPQFAAGPARAHAFAAAYHQVGVQTAVSGADPHRLVALLFDGCLEALAQARGAMRAGQVEAKGRAIGRAARIVEEGLRAALDLREGGSLAADLDALYGYLTLRLMHANRHNDEAALAECERLIEPLREAWQAIAPSATTR